MHATNLQQLWVMQEMIQHVINKVVGGHMSICKDRICKQKGRRVPAADMLCQTC